MMNAELWPMYAIPVHLERLFEQRWASRFGSQAVSIALKNAGTKSTPSKLSSRTAAKCKEILSVNRPEVIHGIVDMMLRRE